MSKGVENNQPIKTSFFFFLNIEHVSARNAARPSKILMAIGADDHSREFSDS